MKSPNYILWLVGLILVYLFVFKGNFMQTNVGTQAISGSERVVRVVPSTQVVNGTTFQVRYDVEGTSGKWGVNILDYLTGGCSFVATPNNQIKTVMLSLDNVATKIVEVQAPNTTGQCNISGTYQFGTYDVTNFGYVSTISIVAPNCTPVWTCANSTWSDNLHQCGTRLQTCTDSVCGLMPSNKLYTNPCSSAGSEVVSTGSSGGAVCSVGQSQACTIGSSIGTMSCTDAGQWSSCLVTQTPEVTKCQVYEKLDEVTNTCGYDWIVISVVAIILIIVAWKVWPGKVNKYMPAKVKKIFGKFL